MLIKINLFWFFILLTGTVIGQNLKNDSLPVNLGKNINSKNAEIAPVISPDGKTLYFSRDYYHKEVEKTVRWSYHMIMVEYQTIFSSQLDSTESWRPAKKMKDEMNSSEFNALCSISPDGNNILVYKFPKLYISHRNGSNWGTLIEQKMDNFYDSSSFCNFYLSNDGRYLLSAVTRQQHRKEDIFVSFLLGENHWSAPKNLGPAINSHGREISPFLAADNRTLYLSSDRWEGLGEMDIYVSHRHDSSWTDWSPPKNLGYPINSSGWDAYLSIPASGDHAYFVSTQSGFGEEDIFKVSLPEWARPHPLAELTGKVTDEESGKPLKAEIIFESPDEENERETVFTDSLSGEFKVMLHPDENYSISFQSPGYFPWQNNFTFLSDSLMEFKMQKIKICTLQTIRDFLFESGSYNIGKSDSIELTGIANFLIVHPELNIELTGYTDAAGKRRYNRKLSLLRAVSVKEFLISKGVSKNRITISGKGQDLPLMANDTEEGKKMNRRVEINLIPVSGQGKINK
jgi:outer membrane protein OmpA-like peptidoglycan-associated protein